MRGLELWVIDFLVEFVGLNVVDQSLILEYHELVNSLIHLIYYGTQFLQPDPFQLMKHMKQVFTINTSTKSKYLNSIDRSSQLNRLIEIL